MFLFNFTHWNAPQSRCRWDLYRFRPLVIYPRGRRAGVRAAPTAGCGPGGCGISLSPPGCRGSPGRLGAAGPAERGWDAPRPGEPGAALAAFPGRREGLARGGAWGGGGGGVPGGAEGGTPRRGAAVPPRSRRWLGRGGGGGGRRRGRQCRAMPAGAGAPRGRAGGRERDGGPPAPRGGVGGLPRPPPLALAASPRPSATLPGSPAPITALGRAA